MSTSFLFTPTKTVQSVISLANSAEESDKPAKVVAKDHYTNWAKRSNRNQIW